MKEYRLASFAWRDVHKEVDYYRRTSRDPATAKKFWNRVFDGLELVAAHPSAWEHADGVLPALNVRMFPLKPFPFGLIYREEATEVVAYAIADLRRRQGYWRRRLG